MAGGDDRLQHLYLSSVKPNGKKIGVGAYGRVFEVEFCGSIYAGKEIHPVLVEGVEKEEFERMKRMFIDECHQSSALGHENIVRVLGVYNPAGESRLPVLVMERMKESLTSLVEKNPNIPVCVKLSMLLDVSRGLWYLHDHDPPIVHRDLSPNNILLNSQFVAKISDLGVAKVIRVDSKKTKTRAPGTVDFMGPEALAEFPEYGPSLDVFSYGGVILHVVNQEWPKPLHYVVTDPKTRKLMALTELERRQEHLKKMMNSPVDLKYLVEQCLSNDPAKRPLISEVSKSMSKIKEAESLKCPNVTLKVVDKTGNQTVKKYPSITIDKNIFQKAKMKWRELAPLPVHRTAHTAVLLHGSIYVGGGFDETYKGANDFQDCYRLDVYNLTTNRWDPSPLTTPFSWFAMAILDDKLIIAGGRTRRFTVTNKVLFLDEGDWKDYSEMPTARERAAAVGHRSMLIVVGGLNESIYSPTTLATTELLDTTNKLWYTCDALPVPHSQLNVTIVDDKLYLLGGLAQDTVPSPQIFSTSLDNLSSHQLNWQPLPDTPWCYSTPVTLYNKLLLAVGGRQSCDGNSQTSAVCAFNSSTGLWKQIVDIPAARSFPAVVGVADYKMVVVGGMNAQREFSSNTWICVFE